MKKVSLLLVLFSVFAFSQKYTKAEISRITEGNIDSALTIFQTSDSLQHKVLLDQSMDANPKDKYTKILVNRMKLALLSTGSGVGIAAPQVGINRNITWAKRFDKDGKPLEYFINPKILWRSEVLNLGPEGDLSIEVFRDYFYRSQVIQLEYFDLDGKKHTEIVEGFTAIILQHEIDHLSGILISDKIENQKMKNFEKVEFYKEIK
ncbi:peptide deformylase [Kaistella antarctica]|uniref:Peptide deformylase-like n=1 Tax=Kaistella antarctica TaxID=266748 RepID=A0A448NPJ9_9FLAO|nr:peptide deformylase [Kaistella antarctica]KEY19392.1 peptide deformylase [Kaistella antarctica]SEW06462.1 peptide deformylase [Kaistella antarctica]VEH97571.1 Peptide deformylase [Kaistella antarctica]